jgi:hypothetical protein
VDTPSDYTIMPLAASVLVVLDSIEVDEYLGQVLVPG